MRIRRFRRRFLNRSGISSRVGIGAHVRVYIGIRIRICVGIFPRRSVIDAVAARLGIIKQIGRAGIIGIQFESFLERRYSVVILSQLYQDRAKLGLIFGIFRLQFDGLPEGFRGVFILVKFIV